MKGAGDTLQQFRVQGIPARSGQIIEQVLVQLPDMLREDMAQLLVRLAEFDAEAGSDEACCNEARARLRDNGDAFLPALVDALADSCRRACGATGPGDGGAVIVHSTPELRLLDDDVAEEEALLAGIGRRIGSHASLSLMLLGQRFGVLLARPPVPVAALPLGPGAFCDALALAAERTGLCTHLRLALFRLYDVEWLEHYPALADAIDAGIDRAGILRGMSFVPLRRKAYVATSVAQATERDALRAVSHAADALGAEAGLPPQAQSERRAAIGALARFLMRHGRDSSQWSECIDVADSLQDAAMARTPAPDEAEAWLRKAFAAVGYTPGDAVKLAAGLTAQHGNGEVEAPPRERGVREQRCFDRLQRLPVGTMLGFSAGGGGFLHARLEAHQQEPARLLLYCHESECEIMFELDTLARLLASGEAWVMRAGAPITGGMP